MNKKGTILFPLLIAILLLIGGFIYYFQARNTQTMVDDQSSTELTSPTMTIPPSLTQATDDKQFPEVGQVIILQATEYAKQRTPKSANKIIALELRIYSEGFTVFVPEFAVYGTSGEFLDKGFISIYHQPYEVDKNFRTKDTDSTVVLFKVPLGFNQGLLYYENKKISEFKLSN